MFSSNHRHITRTVLASGILFILAAWNPAGAAELPFGSQTDILTSANTVNGPTDLVAGDLNDDGNMDLVMCAQGSGQVWVAYAYAGGGTTGATIATGLDSPRSVDVGDIDQDGDLDVIVGQYNNIAYPGQAEIIWYERVTAGWTEHSVSYLTYGGVRSIKLVDLDQDGDLDHVWAEGGTHPKLGWRKSTLADTGTMGWGTGHTIGSGLDRPWDVEISDIDCDGDPDVVLPDVGDDAVYWYENDGTPDAGWTRHTVATGFDGARSVSVGDIDQDGAPDIVASATIDDHVVWYEKVGASWTEHNIVVGINNPASVEVADMDFDGDLDVVVSRESGNEVLWIENRDGDGGLWLRNSVDASFSGAVDAIPVDLDGDGDLDIAAVGYIADKLSWWENENTHRRFADAEPLIIRDGLNNPRAVATADINGDGLNDVIMGGWDDAFVKVYLGINEAAWWENTVDGGTNRFRDVSAADIDQDGDLDVLGASVAGDVIYWWANDGGALPSWTRHTVLSSFNGAHTVEPIDLDADGDLDLVVCAVDGDEATIVINDDGVGGSWTKKNFVPLNGAYEVAIGDLNDDGMPDFVASGYYEDVIRVNLQFDPLWGFADITGLDGPRGVALGDFDNDGDLDIVGAIRNDDDIKWFENDGAGGTWTAHNVGSGYLNDGSSVQAVDVDHDGDVDVLGTGYGGHDVYLWKNDGDGSSWTRRTIESGLDSPWQALADDLNGDNKMDLVLTAAGTTDSLTWYKNIGAQFVTTAYDYAPSLIEDGEKDSIFLFIIMNNGRVGPDHDLEINSLQLYFEDESGTPVTSSQINNAVDRMEIYLDSNDDMIWNEGVDALIATDLYLSLSGGTLTFSFIHGIAENDVAPEAAEGFFVVLEAASDASQQALKSIFVTMKTDQLQCQDRTAETSLIAEPAEDETTDLISFGSNIFSDGFEGGNTNAWDATAP